MLGAIKCDALLVVFGFSSPLCYYCYQLFVYTMSQLRISVFLFFSDDALKKNQELEFQRNQERFKFLKWGAKAFSNMQIIPPGSGIVHQVI